MRAVSGAHEGQDGERRREEERDCGAFFHELGGLRDGSRPVGLPIAPCHADMGN